MNLDRGFQFREMGVFSFAYIVPRQADYPAAEPWMASKDCLMRLGAGRVVVELSVLDGGPLESFDV